MFIDVSVNDWAMAARIGQSRRLSNSKRNKTRDRGNKNNIMVDLMGSVGEVLAYKSLSDKMSFNNRIAYMDDIFKVAGGSAMKGADMTIDNHAHGFRRLDIKTYECAPNKRYFAINNKKHLALENVCDGYFCVLFALYGKKAFIVDYVPYDDVSNWENKALGKYGDPSRNMNIKSFTTNYGDSSVIKSLLSDGVYERNEISDSIASNDVVNTFNLLIV